MSTHHRKNNRGGESDAQKAVWNIRYNELQQFVYVHGHCRVPAKYPANPTLGEWVSKQRYRRKFYDQGKSSSMTPERIELLDSLGMIWAIGGKGANTPTWEKRLAELRAFKEEHGHLRIPGGTPLAKFATDQRSKFKLFMAGKKGATSDERMRALAELGFEFVRTPKPTGDGPKRGTIRAEKWKAMMKELKLYKELHGDTNVPKDSEEYPDLAKWITTTRRQYIKMKTQMHESKTLTPERIRALEALGIDWWANSNAARWNSKVEELREFKKAHGHCVVPGNYPENQPLAKWVNQQRTRYRKYCRGEQCGFMEERFRLLDAMGFEWELLDKRAFSNEKEVVRRVEEKLAGQQREGGQNEEADGGDGGDVPTINPDSMRDVVWQMRLEELKLYKEKHGHTLVPVNSPEAPQLSRWVCTQRNNYKQQVEGKATRLTEARIAQLNDLDFAWSVKEHHLPDQRNQEYWAGRLDECQAFVEKFGHCRIPYSYGKLGKWACQQRHMYRKYFVDGHRSVGAGVLACSLTEDRVRSLDELGFSWQIGKGTETPAEEEEGGRDGDYGSAPVGETGADSLGDLGQSTKAGRALSALPAWKPALPPMTAHEKLWRLRFEQLRAYTAKYGDCSPTSTDKEHGVLGKWLTRQRKLYRRDKLSKERIDLLEELGVEWSGRKGRVSRKDMERRKKAVAVKIEDSEVGIESTEVGNDTAEVRGKAALTGNEEEVHENEETVEEPSSGEKQELSASELMILELTCVKCAKMIVKSTVSQSCGHLFCAACIDALMEKNRKCPKCQVKISGATAMPQMDIVIASLVKESRNVDSKLDYLDRRLGRAEHNSCSSVENVRERNCPDGSIMPAVTPKIAKDGSYVKPRGRKKKGMDWDAVRGLWVPKSNVGSQSA